MIRYLSVEAVVAVIAPAALGAPAVVRDPGLLESALARPASSAFGVDAYPDLLAKAAALLHGIVSGHPFLDGNKRIGWVAANAFLEVNGVELAGFAEDDAYMLVMAVAGGEADDVDRIAGVLGGWARPVSVW